MNCREAQSQIFAERDGALDHTRRAALDGHVAHCSDCQRIRESLTAALVAWSTEANQVTVPDAEREWHAVRRRIRGGAGRVSPPRRNFFTWVALPLGAAAAAAVAFFVFPQSTVLTDDSGADSAVHIARANSVEVSGSNAATVVFVDDKSGWLFVMASVANPKQG